MLEIGLIGCGGVGLKRSKQLPAGVHLKVVFDTDHWRKAQLITATMADDIDHFFRIGMDAVIIATPNAFLVPYAMMAVKKGIHVLIEKPGAVSCTQLKELASEATLHKALVRVGYNHRYHAAALEAGRYEIGDVMFVRGRYGHGARVGYENEWRANPALSGGGELIDQGVHLIDLAQLFLGPIELVHGMTPTFFWNMKVEDNAFLCLKSARGRVAWLHVSCTEWRNMFSFEVYGTTGKLHWEGLGGSYGIERLTYHRMSKEMGPPATVITEYPMEDRSWHTEMKDFMEDIALNRVPMPGLSEAEQVLKIVEQVYNQV